MKRPIPAILPGDDNILRALAALKENQEQMMGQRGGALTKLSSTASTAEIVDAINVIIEKLQ